jgi:competence protein ComEC
MVVSPPTRPPALPVALSLIAGVVLVSGRVERAQLLGPLVALCLAAGLAARRARPRRALGWLCLAALAAGMGLEVRDRAAWTAATAGFLDPDGAPRELHVVGRVLAPAEADGTGDRVLRLRGGPDPPGTSPARPATLLLRVSAAATGDQAIVDALVPGDTVRVWCRLRRPSPPRPAGGPDPRHALRAAGLDALGSVKSARLIERVGRAEAGLHPRAAAGLIKRWARARLDTLLAGQTAVRALAGAMLLGDREALPPEDVRTLRDAGLVHLISISGVHVGLLAWLLAGVVDRVVRSRWGRLALLAGTLGLFGLLVGARSCVERAVLGALAARFGRCIGREGDLLNSLALIAAWIAARDPAAVRDPAFQLTFLATAGIVHLGPRLTRCLPLPRPLAVALALSLAAHLSTAPIVAWHFGRQSAVAVASNLIAEPLCALFLICTLVGTALLDVPALGNWCAALASTACHALLAVGRAAASFEPGSGAVPPPSVLALAACAAILWRPRSRTSAAHALAVLGRGLGAAAALWVHVGPPPEPAGPTRVALIDVGQGLAVALRGPRGSTVLVDAGGGSNPRYDPGERAVVPFLAGWGTRRLDALVLSHADQDHCGGAFAVLRDIEVGTVWLPPGSSADPTLSALAALARRQGSAVALAAAGRSLDAADLPIAILAPSRHAPRRRANDGSIVLRAGAAPARLLVPGDLEAAGERALLASPAPLRAEALVLGHHGSRSSSTSEFLDRVDPRLALVAAGSSNPFGHPHQEVLRRLAERDLVPLRTDRLGSIELRAGPRGWIPLGPIP